MTLNDGGGSATFEIEDTLDINGTLTISNGTLDVKASENNAMTVAGQWLNSDIFLARSGTVTFDAASGIQDIQSNGSAFNHIEFNGANGTWELEDTLDVNGTLTITTGTLDTNNSENNGITITGNWLNSGSFLARNGLVTFNATGGVIDIQSGSSAFNDVTLNDGGAIEIST